MLLEHMRSTWRDRLRVQANATAAHLLRATLGRRFWQVVVCGFPRGGTSLMYNMLSATLEGFQFEQFENYFIYRIHRLANIASKAPMDVMHLERIDELNRNGKHLAILVLVRDPRDVLTSRHPMLPDEYFISHDFSWWPRGGSFDDWAPAAPGLMQVAEAIRKVRDRQDVTVIRYEDLVADPDGVQRQISQQYGLAFSGPFSAYHNQRDRHAYRYEGRYAARDQGLVLEGSALSAARAGRWQHNASDVQRVQEQFRACPELYDLLLEYGYSKPSELSSAVNPDSC